MWVAELQCALGHAFEGWFGSREDFAAQWQHGLVTCPHCGHARIERRLSAPRLNLGADAPAVSAVPAEAPQHAALREWLIAIKAGAEDLGSGFPAEARRIQRGEAPERPIRGRASPAQFEALLDEGIAVLPLPDPDCMGPVH